MEAAVDGSLDFLHMNSLVVEVLYITSTVIILSKEPDQTPLLLHDSSGHFPHRALPGVEIMKT